MATRSFKTAISKMAKFEEKSLTGQALGQLDDICCQLGRKLGDISSSFAKSQKKVTVEAEHVYYATTVLMTKNLSNAAIGRVAIKLKDFSSAKEKRVTEKLGIFIEPSRAKQFFHTQRISKLAANALAIVIDYICTSIIQAAGNKTAEEKKERINSRCLMMGIEDDDHLKKLIFGKLGVHIAKAGETKEIAEKLLEKPKRSKRSSPRATEGRRSRPGTVALRQIKKEQKNVEFSLRKATFKRLTKAAMSSQRGVTVERISATALNSLQAQLEGFAVKLIKRAGDIAINRGLVTVQAKDVEFAFSLCGGNHIHEEEDSRQELAKHLESQSVKKLARKAGVKRIGKVAIESIKHLILDELVDLLRIAMNRCVFSKRKTLALKDVKHAAKELGIFVSTGAREDRPKKKKTESK